MAEAIATKAVDVTGVFDSAFNQLFPEAIAMKATVRESSRLMTHPLETGSVITDHRVIDPTEIELSLILPGGAYVEIYQRIKAIYRGNDTVIVQTKTGSYSNMVMQGIPHDETPEMGDAVTLGLKLQEAQFITAQFQALPPRAVRDPKDISTVKRGEQNTTQSSLLFRLFH